MKTDTPEVCDKGNYEKKLNFFFYLLPSQLFLIKTFSL